jgi:hypothetical protein
MRQLLNYFAIFFWKKITYFCPSPVISNVARHAVYHVTICCQDSPDLSWPHTDPVHLLGQKGLCGADERGQNGHNGRGNSQRKVKGNPSSDWDLNNYISPCGPCSVLRLGYRKCEEGKGSFGAILSWNG